MASLTRNDNLFSSSASDYLFAEIMVQIIWHSSNLSPARIEQQHIKKREKNPFIANSEDNHGLRMTSQYVFS